MITLIHHDETKRPSRSGNQRAMTTTITANQEPPGAPEELKYLVDTAHGAAAQPSRAAHGERRQVKMVGLYWFVMDW